MVDLADLPLNGLFDGVSMQFQQGLPRSGLLERLLPLESLVPAGLKGVEVV